MTRRTWPNVANLVKPILALTRAVRQLLLLCNSLGQFTFVRGDIVEHPVDEIKTEWGVLIRYDQRETLGPFRRRFPRQFRGNVVLAFTGRMCFWDRVTGKAGTSQFQGRNALLGNGTAA